MKTFSVTECLGPYFDKDRIPPDVLDAACKKGTAAHKACETFASGIPVMGVAPEVEPYFISFKSWFLRFVKQVYFVEKEFFDDDYKYVGHLDIGCQLIDLRNMIVDYKTPYAESPTWKLQGAGYLNLARKNTDIEWDGFMSLRLRPNGSPAIATVYDEHVSDFAAFLSALNVYRYIH